MNTEPKFIADASLAGLARWLRLLGFDTVVYSGQAGRAMMRQAAGQNRILLTRRRDLMERQFAGELLLLPDMETAKQIHYVIGRLSLEIHLQNLYTRCLSCNERLVPRDRESVRDRVPEYVFEHCSQYNQCPKCLKIYWPGTHGRNALKFLKENDISMIHDEGRQETV
ncbi:MAG: Mut7-C RNAse domain-containing protein [Smithellaceae bacterium]|jgi:hypothetical protein